MRSRRELNDAIRRDLAMQGLRERDRFWLHLTRPTARFVVLLRAAEYYTARSSKSRGGSFLAAFARFRARRYGLRLGLDVPPGTFGPGLSIAHSGLLVVHADARIGARCRISQGVTIGASDAGAPVIGDDVFLGPNAIVIGPVAIGDRAFIYPGAVVVNDVPAHHAARGVPATNVPYEGNPWRPGTGFGGTEQVDDV